MNEIISLICNLPIIFTCNILYNLSYAKLTHNKMSINFRSIILNIITAILVLFNNNLNVFGIKIILNFIILVVQLKLLFNDDYKKIIINYIFLYFLICLVEMFSTKLLLVLSIFTNNATANTTTLINIFLTIATNFIVYILLSIPIIRNIFQKIVYIFLTNKIISNIIYLIFITIAVISIFYVNNFSNDNSFSLILMLYFVFTILFILVVKSKFNEEMLKVSNKKLIEYNSNYGKFLDEYKIYKHNINHKLSNMKSYGNKKINALIDDLLEEETTFSIRNNEIYNVPNGIKGIVAEKLYNNKYDIVIDNKIKEDPFSKLSPRAFNSVSECLGIVLDNAIEASEKTENPIIVMDLYEDETHLYLKIGNNYCNNIDLDAIGTKYYSTKNRDSGLGLFSIAQNKLVKEKISIINNFYYIELQIKKAR